MRIDKSALAVALLIIGLFCFWFFYLRHADRNRLMKVGYEVVEKVEKYKEVNHKLPDSLAQVGVKEDEETETYLNYQKQDSLRYFVWIGISSEESKFYYSDTKKWEDYFRKME